MAPNRCWLNPVRDVILQRKVLHLIKICDNSVAYISGFKLLKTQFKCGLTIKVIEYSIQIYLLCIGNCWYWFIFSWQPRPVVHRLLGHWYGKVSCAQTPTYVRIGTVALVSMTHNRSRLDRAEYTPYYRSRSTSRERIWDTCSAAVSLASASAITAIDDAPSAAWWNVLRIYRYWCVQHSKDDYL